MKGTWPETDRNGNRVAALMEEPGEGQRWAGLVEDNYWRVRVVDEVVVTEAIHDDVWRRISTSGVGSRVRETVLEMALKHGKRPAARVARPKSSAKRRGAAVRRSTNTTKQAKR